MRKALAVAGLMVAAIPGRGAAQDAGGGAARSGQTQPTAPDDETGDDIIVKGNRTLPGAVIGDIPPEQQLGPADIRSYGVSSISDLLNELAPETRSDRGHGGAPVVLLDGRRISGFNEIRDIPTEAIARVDILPEEVALKYGYGADQRVVNIVLRRRFHALTVEGTDTAATEGGTNTPHVSADLLRIGHGGRINLNLDYQATSRLLESERDLTGLDGGAFDLAGNIAPAGGAAEIDPALSAAAGAPVTITGVPAAAAIGAPTLGDFVAGANAPNRSDLSRYRTLLPSSRDFSANLVYARPIGKVSATVNARIEASDSNADQGLAGIAVLLRAGNPYSPFSDDVMLDRYVASAPLTQHNQAITGHFGASLNGNFGKWRWSATGNYDRSENDTVSDTGVDAGSLQAALLADDPAVNPYGPLARPLIGALAANRAFALSSAGGADALLSGPLLHLPAGDVSTSLKAGFEASDFDTHAFRPGVESAADITRGIADGQINLDVPLTSRRYKFGGAIGDLSANFNYAVNHLSDFGTLDTLGYGASWSPIPQVELIVSVTDQDEAPTPQQLGNPIVITPNTRVFDYVAGQTVDVTQVAGGNPALVADDRRVFKAGLTVKPLDNEDLTLSANYIRTRTDDPIASFPSATAAIEAAFPDRFTRDAGGELVRIDSRPVNFDREDTSELRWGINISHRLKSHVQKQIEAYRSGTGANPFTGLNIPGLSGRRRGGVGNPVDGPGGAPPTEGARRFDGGGGFGGRGQFGGGGGRLQFALYHTWHFEDRIAIRDGLSALDLLHGNAIGNSGGQPRHELELQAGYSNNGLGARLNANWQSATTVFGGTAAAPETLHFGSLGTASLRLFDDLGGNFAFVRKHRWAAGTRITVSVQNLFDTRQRVTDAAGDTPVRYEPGYLDPLGRTVMLSIRKLLF